MIRATENEWNRHQSEVRSAPKSYFIAWYSAGDTNDYEILQAADLDDALNIAKTSYGETLEDVQPYEP